MGKAQTVTPSRCSHTGSSTLILNGVAQSQKPWGEGGGVSAFHTCELTCALGGPWRGVRLDCFCPEAAPCTCLTLRQIALSSYPDC